jgi:hypothetical protein
LPSRRVPPTHALLGEQDVRRVRDGAEGDRRQSRGVRAVGLPDLDDQQQPRQRERQRDPDARADLLAVDEACPQRDEDRTDELDHERDPDRDAVDREEVGPLHEREPTRAERDDQRQLRAAKAE